MGLSEALYNFAVYQFFWIALAIFAFGVVYRIGRMFALWKRPIKAPRRARGGGYLVKTFIETFIDPIIFSLKKKPHDFTFGLLLLHLLGVLPIIFLLGEHVVVWSYYFPPYWLVAKWGLWIPESIISGTLTVTTPVPPVGEMSYMFVSNIWGPLNIILNGDLLAILALIGVGGKIGMKLLEAAKREKNVRLGDIIDYALLLGILLAGYLAARFRGDVIIYRELLALHVLFAELLLAWLPFSKYWHFVFGYWYGKLHEWWDTRYQRGA